MAFNFNKNKGFTLIELMAVVAIIGILASFAIPQYQSYIVRTYRSDAMKELLKVLQAQERYYSNEITYTTDLTKLGYSNPLTIKDGGNTRYTITASTCSSGNITQCIQLKATPTGAQANDGTILADSIGTQTRTVGSTTYDWSGNKI